MENLKWRSRAKVVAWMHMIIIAVFLGLLIAGAAVITAQANILTSDSDGDFDSYSKGLSDGNKQQIGSDSSDEAIINAMIRILWIIVGISVVMTAIEIWGAVMLLNATKATTGANDCYRNCKNYISITSIVLVLDIVGIIFSQNETSLVSGIFVIILRAGFIFVASQFRKEVEPYVLTQTYGMEQAP